ncbi:sugar ABC transporter ATP-binding protein [Exiguobacterium artemiae]|uniref:sugar ABC transporter ATP-binding protein n=1 Tax=Exiguobacterium artemiae TaxID=340145 RepID=UPI0029648E2A|nr:sugar ABC transporter ATP-binding protein [Exiguobacterium sibiricum]MDW2884769.1 sugar ABC transporter ATP-binding protein [Exiguobacterium sibiricum]
MTPPVNEQRLEMRGISMEFPGVKALDDVHFSVKRGEIHALVGANGAGKSTLMKVLAGAYASYDGTILFDGVPLAIDSPSAAKQAGIEIVYQEVDTALVDYLTVAENICLDMLASGQLKGVIRRRRYEEIAERALQKLKASIDVRQRVSELRLAEKQLVLIARALVQESRFLILDEPTAPLSGRETEQLFRIIRELAEKEQLGVIFISHRLQELFEICESISVMRDGRLVARQLLAGQTKETVVEQMLGRRLQKSSREARPAGAPSLELDRVTVTGQLDEISLTVRAGEVIGIAGLVGAGKTELCKTIFGSIPVTSGSIRLAGETRRIRSAYDAVRLGIGLVPEERRKEGILVADPIEQNMTAASLKQFVNRFGFVEKTKERAAANRIVQQLSIKVSDTRQRAAELSGGNQQKVAIGKWLLADASVLVLDEPTKGVDVGAKAEIFQVIDQLAAEQKAVIYASSELDELLAVTDRIYVMYDGQIVFETTTAETTEEQLLWYATGGQRHE